jgi:hypothetical protein
MPIEEYDGVIINKVTLAKYKELKAAGSLVASQTYVITDLDERLEELELPNRLGENTLDSQVYYGAIDDAVTGFYLWDCNNHLQLRPDINESYYYVYSNIANSSTGTWGSQIAIAESTNKMYFRSRDENGWNEWKYVLNSTDDNLYWQVRVGRIIPTGTNFIFYNTNSIDMSSLPLNEILMTHKGQNDVEWNFKLIYEDSQYVLKMIKGDNTYSSEIATGQTLNEMSFRLQYSTYGEAAYGSFNKITYIHENLLSIIDNLMRINNCDF